MKNIIYILSLCMLLTTSCSKDFIDELGGSGAADNEGTLKLTYSLASTKSTSDAELLAKSKLKIYREDGELIRYYKPATEAPDELYLVAGKYSAELAIDASTYATTSFDECAYYGDASFEITANESNNVSITSSITNSAIKIVYDETIIDNFEEGYITYVTASDAYDKQTAESDKLYTLSFTSSGVGYFILPDEVSNISWGFSGVHSDPEVGTLSLSGVISNPKAATAYTLNFKYSETAGGVVGGLTISIDESSEEFDDSFAFSPQPTITPLDFSISSTQVYSGENSYSLAVSAVNSLKSITLEMLDDDGDVVESYSPLDGDIVDLSTSGLAFEYSIVNDEESSKVGTLTISDDFLTLFSSGGVKSVNIVAKDVLSAKSEVTPQFVVPGILDNPTLDLWANSGVFQACVPTASAENVVKIAYRKSGEEDWSEATATSVGDYLYEASFSPTWSETTSDGGDKVYYLNSGFTAGNTYEYKYYIDGVDQGKLLSYTASEVQTIASSGFESSSLSCWGSSNSSSTWWASGNNSFSSSLCTQGTYSGAGGSACAYLAGASVSLVDLAAGNLFLGQFERPSLTSGQVSFGQSFDWTSRPTSLKFKYAASLGTVNASYKGEYIEEGETDQARIFFAIVDWSDRHVVTSGTSSVSGVWDPATMSSVTEGEIIGYASLWITSSTSGSMQEKELTVYYYDKETKPSKDITIVISCATSAYGDYFNGSTSSKLYVDDFEFGY